MLGIEEREVDPRNPDLLESDRDISTNADDVVLDEIGPLLEELETVLGPSVSAMLFQKMGRSAWSTSTVRIVPALFASRSAFAMQTALKPRAVPVSRSSRVDPTLRAR